jgi:hypothetical protein
MVIRIFLNVKIMALIKPLALLLVNLIIHRFLICLIRQIRLVEKIMPKSLKCSRCNYTTNSEHAMANHILSDANDCSAQYYTDSSLSEDEDE